MTDFPHRVHDANREKVLPKEAIKIANDLWVLYEKTPKEYMRFEFLEFAAYETYSDETIVNIIADGNGYLPKRQCRHIYWGVDGYFFYPKEYVMVAILNWLKKHFDI